TGPAQELPAAVHAEYEESIRAAAREAGRLYLQEGNIPRAWDFFRMLEEPEPVRAALEAYRPGEEEDIGPLVQVAFYEGVHPRKGSEWILGRYGICNAITTVGTQELPFPEDVKPHLVQSLVRSLYSELRGRLVAEVEAQEGKRPAAADEPEGTPGVV